MNFVQNQVTIHRNKIRHRQINEHYFKLLKSRTFEEKVQYFNSQIEILLKELTS